MNRDELALETEHLDLLERVAKAKKGKDRSELHASKDALVAFRQKWRGIREAFASDEPGTAAPRTLKTKAKGA